VPQKWLCSPEGVGALFVRSDRLSELSPTFAGRASLTDSDYDLTGYFLPAQGACRFEVSTMFRPCIRGLNVTMDWLEKDVGWDFVFERIASLAALARRRLAVVPGLSFVTPPSQAGLLTFRLAGRDPVQVATQLEAEKISVKVVSSLDALRISTGFYNSAADIDALVDALLRP
jgi:L-cysteine/cystine lyase